MPLKEGPARLIFVLAAESGPRTRVPRLGLLRLRPDPVHGSPSQGPLLDSKRIPADFQRASNVTGAQHVVSLLSPEPNALASGFGTFGLN